MSLIEKYLGEAAKKKKIPQEILNRKEKIKQLKYKKIDKGVYDVYLNNKKIGKIWNHSANVISKKNKITNVKEWTFEDNKGEGSSAETKHDTMYNYFAL